MRTIIGLLALLIGMVGVTFVLVLSVHLTQGEIIVTYWKELGSCALIIFGGCYLIGLGDGNNI